MDSILCEQALGINAKKQRQRGTAIALAHSFTGHS
jgi:hypothetical protein